MTVLKPPVEPFIVLQLAGVVQVLSAYTRYSNSVYGELAFQPIDRHYGELDDGSEPPEHYEEY